MHITLQPGKPCRQFCTVNPKFASPWRREYGRKDLGQGGSFEIHVTTRVSHCCVKAGMTKPLCNGGEVDSRFE